MLRPRFRVSSLFWLTLVVAGLCYWSIRPTILAQRFVAAIQSKNYSLADSYFRDDADRFLFDENERRWHFHANASVEPSSFAEFVRGKRLLQLRVLSADAGPMRDRGYSIVATHRGLLTPQTVPTDFGSGFGGIAQRLPHSTKTLSPQ